MGWTIILENEQGEAIRTLAKGFDYNALNKIDLKKFIFLKYIDHYGDTTFNRLQMDDLEKDFESLSALLPNHLYIIREILNLVMECRSTVHTYITFYGD